MPRAPKRAKSPSTAQLLNAFWRKSAAQLIKERKSAERLIIKQRKSAAQLIKQRPELYRDRDVVNIILEAVKTRSPAEFLLSKGLNAPRLRERFISTRNLISLGFPPGNLDILGFSRADVNRGLRKRE